jgi:hypothetical protein
MAPKPACMKKLPSCARNPSAKAKAAAVASKGFDHLVE